MARRKASKKPLKRPDVRELPPEPLPPSRDMWAGVPVDRVERVIAVESALALQMAKEQMKW